MPNRTAPVQRPVIALGLDAGDPVLLEKWMGEGRLPNLARLRAGGAYGRLHSTVSLNGQVTEAFATEPLWVDFATGRKPTRTGAWDSVAFDCDRYSVRNLDEGSPAFDPERRVAVVDVPMTRLSAGVHGAQVLGWGGHFPHTRSESSPPGLLAELTARHGANPVLYQDTGIWWDTRYVRWLDQALADSVAARTRLMRDLLSRERWDLFLGIYAEPHTAGHDVYVYSQPDHPLNAVAPNPAGTDLLRRTYEQVDAGIGEIAAAAPADAAIVCFSLHGMGPNYSDQLSSVMLSEALYRMSFPGEAALAPGVVGAPLPAPVARPHRNAWVTELWTRHVAAGPATRLMRSYLGASTAWPRRSQREPARTWPGTRPCGTDPCGRR
jgi:predicted AlkP superfamily phosphohydrolase/phosphomutase